MNRTGKFLLFIAAMGLILIATVCAVSGRKEISNLYRQLFSRHTKILAPAIPDTIAFAGEKVPMELFYVREALDREILSATFMHSSTILMFKRAYRWFPVIEPILKKNGIPDDFKFIAVAESNLLNVVSPAKAEGYWQFLESTGKQYGLEINKEVDERYHMEKATEAACAFFKASYQKFGSWTLVAASYNRGSDGLQRAIDSQKVTNFYDLYLNDETARYIFRILAYREVYTHPGTYGFYLVEQDFYPTIPCKVVTVDTSITDLPAFAKSLSLNYRILRELNPWIQSYSLPNKQQKRYLFRIPEDGVLKGQKSVLPARTAETFFHDTLGINELN